LTMCRAEPAHAAAAIAVAAAKTFLNPSSFCASWIQLWFAGDACARPYYFISASAH